MKSMMKFDLWPSIQEPNLQRRGRESRLRSRADSVKRKRDARVQTAHLQLLYGVVEE